MINISNTLIVFLINIKLRVNKHISSFFVHGIYDKSAIELG